MKDAKDQYQYIADPWHGRWTYANENGTYVIEYQRGRFCVDGREFSLETQARDYVFEKLNIPQLLPC